MRVSGGSGETRGRERATGRQQAASRSPVSQLNSAALSCCFFVSANRKLHFAGTCVVILLFLLNPRSIPSILFAGGVGYMLCPMLQGLSHGFIEFAATIGTFLIMHKLSTGAVRSKEQKERKKTGERGRVTLSAVHCSAALLALLSVRLVLPL